MSAEVLREAAALMRERAEAAYDSPWRGDVNGSVWTANDDDPEEGPTVYVNGGTYANMRNTGYHIASWHPAVALAAALGMDCTAAALEARGPSAIDPAERAWIDFARAHLSANDSG